MKYVHVSTPELSIDSLQLYDDVYPICGVNWYTQQPKQMNMTGFNVNVDGAPKHRNNNGTVPDSNPDNYDTVMMQNNDDEDSDIDMQNENGDSVGDENGDDDEKIESEDKQTTTKGNTPPIFVDSAPKPKKRQSAGKYDSVLSPNFDGKHICLIRKEIRNSKYFFLYQQYCQCIMSVRNKNNLNLKCSAFEIDGKCCCFVSVGYVSIAIGDINGFIIVYAPIPKCTVHRRTCNIFNYKGKEDKLYLGTNDFICYDDKVLSSIPWLTIIPFNECLSDTSVRNIFVSRYHITETLYKVNYLYIFCKSYTHSEC